MSKGLRNLIIVGVLGWLGWSALSQQAPGDRPTLLVGNNPVRIEPESNGNAQGEFEKGLFGMGRSWYHHHPGHGPTHFEVVVTDSTCGPDATYDTTELSVLSGAPGSSSTFTISIWGAGPFTSLQIDPTGETKITRDQMQTPHQLDVGTREEQLQAVTIAGSRCGFSPGQGSIVVRQKH